MDISERLKEYFKSKAISQKEIAVQLGVTQGYVALMLNGRQPFGRAAAKKWQEAFGLNASWLMTGDGPMLVEERDGLSGSVDRSSHHVSGEGNVVASGQSGVVVSGGGGEVDSLRRQNELLARQNELLMRNIDLLTRQMETLMGNNGGNNNDKKEDGGV